VYGGESGKIVGGKSIGLGGLQLPSKVRRNTLVGTSPQILYWTARKKIREKLSYLVEEAATAKD
jgi:hypothetical protein